MLDEKRKRSGTLVGVGGGRLEQGISSEEPERWGRGVGREACAAG